ncbi:MAG: hypothetical protein ACFNZS_12540 [Ottowia sp.]|jgi:hypothetical protein
MKRHFLPPVFRSWRFAAFSWRGWRLGLAAQLAVDGLQGFVHSEKQNQQFKEYAHDKQPQAQHDNAMPKAAFEHLNKGQNNDEGRQQQINAFDNQRRDHDFEIENIPHF